MVDTRLSIIDSPTKQHLSEISFIEQFVQDVVDFSSQYGSDISISYTAYNISGKPSKFPDYGDFPQAFVMRTYGEWWQEAPSWREVFMPQNFGQIVSQDYIDVKFEQAVYPYGVSVYETYNPGSVVRIWAKTESDRWISLWEGESQTVGHTSRIFTPPIRTINESTRLLRLEFDHSKLEYYTELDAVMLIGTNQYIDLNKRINMTNNGDIIGAMAATTSTSKTAINKNVISNSNNIRPSNSYSDNINGCNKNSHMCTNSFPFNRKNGISNSDNFNNKTCDLDINVLTADRDLMFHHNHDNDDDTCKKNCTKCDRDTSSTSAIVCSNAASASLSSSPINLSAPISDLTEKIIKLNIHAVPLRTDRESLAISLTELRDSLLQELTSDNNIKQTSDIDRANSGPFSCLPDETMLYIFRFLDLVSLWKCAKVNRHFNSIVGDSLLYTELNLKPYWPWITSHSLDVLSNRCKYLMKLDLSWCGNYYKIQTKSFNKFIEECGDQLNILRLDCCKFVDDSSIKHITLCCLNLKELTLRNCSRISSEGFEMLATLENIERLDLYRTSIETVPLVKILKASPNLKHINLGSCVRVSSMDEVAQALGTYNHQLRTVDFWKTYSLTPVGVRALSQCSQLEEIDFGWCLGVSIPGDCMTTLAKGCPKLRKLFMAALRGITNRDLNPFVVYCPYLQQVDLLGVRCITADICVRFLNNCKNLRLLDLSFCDLIQESEILIWRKQYPQVSIKRSYQYEGTTPIGCYFPNHY